jgi:hypothetical protein
MAGQPEDGEVLDELEHQALDTLDSTPLDAVRMASATGAAGIQIEGAIATARPGFVRLIAAMADRLLTAAEGLARSEDRGSLESEALARVRSILNESPELAPALSSAVEGVAVMLGLDRQALAWGLLVEIGEQAHEAAPESVREYSRAIGDRLGAAWAANPSRALRVFRSAAVAAAGPEVRARSLAADHLEHLAVARMLVATETDAATLVDRFDEARAALAASAPAKPDAPETRVDGPKRKFTVVHLILALIVLGLTVWHYALR